MRKSLIILGILNDSDLEWMLANGERKFCQPGDSVIRQGEHSGAICFLIDGAFEVQIEKPVKKVVTVLYPGEIVGEISLLDSRPPVASVVAQKDSLVLAIGNDALDAKMKVDIGFQARMYRALGVFLAQRLRRTTLMMVAGNDDVLDEEAEESLDEIDEEVLEQMDIAGRRFEMMAERVKGR